MNLIFISKTEATNMTNRTKQSLAALCASGLLALGQSAMAYESGSTGADGAFSPQVDTTVQLPEDGVFNYTTVNIPTGVVVSFEKNVTNTPVVILASGDVTIAGTLNVSATNGADTAAKGDGNLGDDGIPGRGGPGGFDGGSGGTIDSPLGGNGLGPGGGTGARNFMVPWGRPTIGCPGNTGGYAQPGKVQGNCASGGIVAAPAYGSDDIQPLIGGSGGGGGRAGTVLGAAGGGGGGGAILIASSGTINVAGAIRANGGAGGDVAGADSGGAGGAGSGGAIRLVATTVSGNGPIEARGGANQTNDVINVGSGVGANGRVKVEAENLTRTAAVGVFSGPQEVFLANIPGVRITSVAGITAPASPTGAGDIVVPEATPNPVAIEFVTTNIPVGNIIELTVTPQSGANTTAVSGAITGTDASGTASVSVEIPDGPSTLSASITFTVAIASLQEDYSHFAKGNKVEKVRIDFDPQQGSMTTFIAANGSEYTWPSNTVAIN